MLWSYWVLAGLVLLIFELLITVLVFAPMAIGALLVALAAALGVDSLETQLVVFSVGSTVLVLTARKYVRPLIYNKAVPKMTSDVDGRVGSIAVVLQPTDDVQGQVSLENIEWSARSESGARLPVGARVRVVDIDGNKVIVTLLTNATEERQTQ